ncbi:two-component system chemotaxis sensor kinase CheA [Duganella sp. SG902]|uniref:chemotaxis protein CheA n=1 Tax=Duganella sp. SG902 TaxID=2587016 RepID=UPI00159E0CF2|nr:chemotaxis protein CheA [Duganella sp. SG902]NVM75824.1 two-component system chemotaxis sensor kinase CheA [Duganella sp. SG902]
MMREALPTFIAEAGELLEQMEGGLLHIEQDGADADAINALFRAVHTLKGSAGLFGLHHIVACAHVAESVLDEVREARLAITPALATLLLSVSDHLAALVALAADDVAPDAALDAAGQALGAALQAYLPAAAETAPPAATPPMAAAPAAAHDGSPHWHLSLRFGAEVLRYGMDPLSFLHYLGTLGEIVHIVAVSGALPPLPELDPERCHLGYELGFRSDADPAAIAGAFEFVREDSRIELLPPGSGAADFVRLIELRAAEEHACIDQLLIACGSVTPAALAAALAPPAPTAANAANAANAAPEAPAAVPAAPAARAARAAEASLIRVDAGKLDQLIDLIGELIIASAGASLAAQQAGAPALLESSTRVARLVEQVRDSALTLRMVAVGATFNRFQRVVRDVSAELGKDIRLEISGADTELDKTVVERIADPLTHLVRNAMDHGIEPAAARRAAGKPAHGTVRLNAYHDAGSIVIEVADDGGGLDKQRILAKAAERGLVEAGAALAERDIYNLIFEPGFSTAAAVSNLSGRGVGMDVVKRNIAALRGGIELSSVAGRGTTVSIRLPLTLAIIDGFLIGVGRATYVVPLELVEECVELDAGQAGAAHGHHYLNLRGAVLPFVRLRELFGGAGGAARRENVVVIRHGGRRVGLVVDRLMGEFQTVIKPLGKVFRQLRGIGGFTILGNGEVALILNVPELIGQLARQHEAAA